MTIEANLAMIKNDKSTAEETGVEVEGVDFMAKRVLSLLVDNTSGVLSRISGLFSRRGYNIDSITAGVTADPRFTRITIVTSGDQYILEQIEKQVSKLVQRPCPGSGGVRIPGACDD